MPVLPASDEGSSVNVNPTGRRLVAAVICAVLVVGAAPAPGWAGAWPEPGSEPGRQVQVGDELYRFDFAGDTAGAAAFLAGHGSIEATVRRVDGDAGSRGHDVITWRLDRIGGIVTSTYTVGADLVEVIFAEEDAASGAGPVTFSVNGVRATVQPGWFDSIMSAGTPAELPPALTAAAEALVDPEGFVQAWEVLAEVSRELIPTAETLDLGLHASPECLGSCAACARSIVLSGMSWVVIASSCGPATLATGGMAFVLCAASVIGHEAILAVALVNCSICLDCLIPPHPPNPPGGGDPDPICPEGTSPCCLGCCEDGVEPDVDCW